MEPNTTVTKGSVSESEQKTTVTNDTVSESVRKEIENSVRANLKAEYERESEELREKIDELEEQGRLTREEQVRLNSLRSDKSEIDEELHILETDPKYRAYRAKIEKENQKTRNMSVSDAKHESSVMLLDYMLKTTAKAEGISKDDLRKEINKIIVEKGQLKDKLPHERFEIAMDEYESRKSYRKREEAIKKRELELRGDLEDGSTTPRDSTIQELKSKNDSIGLAKKLGL